MDRYGLFIHNNQSGLYRPRWSYTVATNTPYFLQQPYTEVYYRINTSF